MMLSAAPAMHHRAPPPHALLRAPQPRAAVADSRYRKSTGLYERLEEGQSEAPQAAPITRPVLLAPAGGWPQVEAAIKGGADAIYFGCAAGLNARARATNFGEDELPALMARLLLQRRISSVQWCVILLLVLGVILVQLKPDAPPTGRETHTMLGLAAVIANAVVGAFAGVWFEKIVKATRPDGRTTNLWVSNLQAASHNACIRASHGAGCVTYDCPACCLPFAALPLLTAAFCRCRAAHRLHRGPRWHGAARLRQCRLLGSCTHDVFCAYCACGVLRRIHSVACVPRCAAAARPKPDTQHLRPNPDACRLNPKP